MIKAENDMLRGQLAKDGNKKVLGPRESLKSTDSSTMLTLTKKLQDAQKLYEKVKSDLGKMKEVYVVCLCFMVCNATFNNISVI